MSEPVTAESRPQSPLDEINARIPTPDFEAEYFPSVVKRMRAGEP